MIVHITIGNTILLIRFFIKEKNSCRLYKTNAPEIMKNKIDAPPTAQKLYTGINIRPSTVLGIGE